MMSRANERSISDGIGELLDQAAELTARFLSDRSELGVSAAFMLNRVRCEGPMRLTDLASREGMAQPSMTQLVQRLERAGLVARLTDPGDGRARLVEITAEGELLIQNRQHIRRERLATLVETLTDEQRTALWLSAHVALPLLSRLIANAEGPAERNQ